LAKVTRPGCLERDGRIATLRRRIAELEAAVRELTAQCRSVNLVSNVVLAGIVNCGFAVFYNTAWGQLGGPALGCMAGHGLCYLALGAGFSLVVAAFLVGRAVGVVSARIALSGNMLVAVITFAGAVTMMPGLHTNRAVAGALQMARLTKETDPAAMAGTLEKALQACLVVSRLALRLVIGTWAVPALDGDQASPRISPSDFNSNRRGSLDSGRTYLPPGPGNRPTEKVPTQERAP
jgi:uncharacterized membrane protein YjjB (DUF3815 family)